MTPQLPAGCVIALLGAESTGKSDLSEALVARLRVRGTAVTRVSEYLREWCEREQRTPRPSEQAAIAAEQTRRIDAAAARGVVVADTTAVMTAVYSHLLFADRSLYDAAMAAQRRYAITLLTAVDLPWVADGLRDGPQVREPVDTLIRAALSTHGVPYAVVHGSGPARLASAWNAINYIATNAMDTRAHGTKATKSTGWTWPCDKCSDPTCEHRLFSDLLKGR